MFLDKARIAIVHDYLNQKGGAERVVAVMHETFPDSPIFTSVVDLENTWPELAGADIRTTWMQGLPGIGKHFKKYLMLYPGAFKSMDLKGYDIVLSSSSAFAKGVEKAAGAVHICYCYTPMRFVWDYERYVEREGFGPLTRTVLPFFIKRLKNWDLKTKNNPDYYIAISTVVKERIRSFYGRDAKVIFPPVDVERFKPSGGTDDFYLVVSRLNPYKRIDLAIDAFNSLGLPLKIIGDGPYSERLKAMAGPNIEFLGYIDDSLQAEYYSRCRALVFPGVEDFGIVPLEANAAGRPVIAFKGGGALDTVVDGVTGLFFEEGTGASLAEAVRKIEDGEASFDSNRVRAHSLKFSKEVFVDELKRYIATVYEERALADRPELSAAGAGGGL